MNRGPDVALKVVQCGLQIIYIVIQPTRFIACSAETYLIPMLTLNAAQSLCEAKQEVNNTFNTLPKSSKHYLSKTSLFKCLKKLMRG